MIAAGIIDPAKGDALGASERGFHSRIDADYGSGNRRDSFQDNAAAMAGMPQM